MILAFRHRGLKRLYENDEAAKLIPEHVDRIRRILAALDSAQTPQDMGTRTFAMHALKGERKGEWAVTVRANWRITFRFKDGNVVDVNLEDYH
jgi:proteic killer suppression protein